MEKDGWQDKCGGGGGRRGSRKNFCPSIKGKIEGQFSLHPVHHACKKEIVGRSSSVPALPSFLPLCEECEGPKIVHQRCNKNSANSGFIAKNAVSRTGKLSRDD